MAKVIVGKTPYEEHEEINVREWQSKIDYINDYAWDGFDYSFVSQMETQIKDHGTLTKTQQNALDNIYEAIQGGYY